MSDAEHRDGVWLGCQRHNAAVTVDANAGGPAGTPSVTLNFETSGGRFRVAMLVPAAHRLWGALQDALRYLESERRPTEERP